MAIYKNHTETRSVIISDNFIHYTVGDSAMVKEMSYVPDSEALVITYKSGASYVYKGVPFSTVTALLSVESVGKAVNSLVKGKYEYIKA